MFLVDSGETQFLDAIGLAKPRTCRHHQERERLWGQAGIWSQRLVKVMVTLCVRGVRIWGAGQVQWRGELAKPLEGCPDPEPSLTPGSSPAELACCFSCNVRAGFSQHCPFSLPGRLAWRLANTGSRRGKGASWWEGTPPPKLGGLERVASE